MQTPNMLTWRTTQIRSDKVSGEHCGSRKLLKTYQECSSRLTVMHLKKYHVLLHWEGHHDGPVTEYSKYSDVFCTAVMSTVQVERGVQLLEKFHFR